MLCSPRSPLAAGDPPGHTRIGGGPLGRGRHVGNGGVSGGSIVARVARYVCLSLAVVSLPVSLPADSIRDFTCFQTGSPYTPELDIRSDVAIVYGVDGSFGDRLRSWGDAGYTLAMMTGIAWGGYEDHYLLPDGSLKREEIQTDANGKLFMHGNSETVGYNVPTPAYVDYIKKRIAPAIDAGVKQIFLEEPEYWARTGWSQGFKDAWTRFYSEPWQAPDSSVDAQYRASRLKYELYFDALREVCTYIDAEAAARGIAIEIIVPTHSLINYAQWRIVSPESHLMDIAGLDGYVAQVWTGTARSANVYRGDSRSRTFETAYLEYGQMLSMVKPTGRKVWFLADPVEDNPNRTWADYKTNYEATIIASLMWPEVHRYEVMPWPNRIFRGTYPETDMADQAEQRIGIPRDYATEILVIINALNDMNQRDIRYDTGTRGIGVVVSDSLMFQRADPQPSDAHLSSFYGLALPLLKAGVPVELAQLENILEPGALEHLHTLLLTYEGQKPLRPEYHDALVQWVREGGLLLYIGDGSDPYNAVRAWWNDDGTRSRLPENDVFERLQVTPAEAEVGPVAVGRGAVQILNASPAALAHARDGAERVRTAVAGMLAFRGRSLDTQNYLRIQRGPYDIVSVFDESVDDSPLHVRGNFIDLFDPALPVVTERVLEPNERTLLLDLDWFDNADAAPRVIAAAARISGETWSGDTFRFSARGPRNTLARARVRLPASPVRVTTTPETGLHSQWHARSRTLWIEFENTAEDVAFELVLDGRR